MNAVGPAKGSMRLDRFALPQMIRRCKDEVSTTMFPSQYMLFMPSRIRFFLSAEETSAMLSDPGVFFYRIQFLWQKFGPCRQNIQSCF